MVDRPFLLIESLMSRKGKGFSEISHVYFKAGWKELSELMNWLNCYLLDEAAPTQLSMKHL